MTLASLRLKPPAFVPGEFCLAKPSLTYRLNPSMLERGIQAAYIDITQHNASPRKRVGYYSMHQMKTSHSCCYHMCYEALLQGAQPPACMERWSRGANIPAYASLVEEDGQRYLMLQLHTDAHAMCSVNWLLSHAHSNGNWSYQWSRAHEQPRILATGSFRGLKQQAASLSTKPQTLAVPFKHASI